MGKFLKNFERIKRAVFKLKRVHPGRRERYPLEPLPPLYPLPQAKLEDDRVLIDGKKENDPMVSI